MPSSNLVMLSVTRSPRFLMILSATKNISRLSPVCGGRCCPSSASSLANKASVPRRFLSAFRSPLPGMFLAVGNSSQSIIATPTRGAALLKPPTSRAATDQLTSRFSPLLYQRPSWWQSRQPLGSPSHRGRFIRSPLGSVVSYPITIGSAGSGASSVTS